jgi:mono/diheme cytochrome c family protein
VITDPTEAPGAWVPRRPDYSPALFGDPSDPPCQTACPSGQICDQGSCKTVSPELAVVTKVLGQGTIRFSSAFNDFALHQLPMAYWVVKPECSAVLQSEQKPADFTGDDRLPWLDARGTPDPNAPVYTTSIGATVFDEICRNCHGPNADGKSANADTILAMTGGTTRVADLRDGLLGPAGDPSHAGDNRALQFAREANRHELSPDDVAVRYLAWMALGGTEKVIPDAVLIAVQNSPVFGEYRHFAIGSPPPPTANMLASARLYCRSILFHQAEIDVTTGWIPEKGYDGTPLLTTNGDADMWRRLCYFENPGPIWGITGEFNNPDDPNSADDWRGVQLSNNRFHRSAYPASTPIGGDHGVVSATLTDDNAVPWCFMPPPPSVDAGIYQAHLQAFWASQGRTDAIPYCPMDALTGQDVQDEIDGSDTEWELRAAANAGRSVFAYIDSVAKGFTPKVHNTECDLLLQSTKSN